MTEGPKPIEGLRPAELPTAADWLDSSPLTLRPSDDLLAAIDTLALRRQPAAPVVAHDGRLLGMLTEKDCLRVLSVGSFHTPREGLVAEVMSPVESSIAPGDDPYEIAGLFLESNFPVLPVCDQAGHLLGTISRHRMLHGIVELLDRFRDARKPSPDVAREVTEGPHGIERMQQVFARFSPKQLVRVMSRRRK